MTHSVAWFLGYKKKRNSHDEINKFENLLSILIWRFRNSMSNKIKYSSVNSTNLDMDHSFENTTSYPVRKESKPGFVQRFQSFIKDRLGSRKDINGELFKATFGEFLATFLFFFCAEASAMNNLRQSQPENLALAAVSITFGATGLIMAFWEISGACFNPAVNFSLYIHGQIPFIKCMILIYDAPFKWLISTQKKVILYTAAQLCASILSAITVSLIFPNDGSTIQKLVVQLGPGVEPYQAFVMEFMLTFVLLFVVFSTALDKGTLFMKKILWCS